MRTHRYARVFACEYVHAKKYVKTRILLYTLCLWVHVKTRILLYKHTSARMHLHTNM